MTKEQQIKEYLNRPFKKDDSVIFTGKGNGSRNPDSKCAGKVVSSTKDTVTFLDYYKKEQTRSVDEVEKDISHIGANPFKKEIKYDSYQIDIDQLLWRTGLSRRRSVVDTNTVEKVLVPECCFNPIIEGEKAYQRDYIWTLEQKQLLIDSIYNHIEIGKFVLRLRSYEYVRKRILDNKMEHTAFKDIVDGKQRTLTIHSFVNNEFKDSYGNYFSDLSKTAQRRFYGYRGLTYVELPEYTTDEETLDIFLGINHTGEPMSKEHIEFVKSLKNS